MAGMTPISCLAYEIRADLETCDAPVKVKREGDSIVVRFSGATEKEIQEWAKTWRKEYKDDFKE